MEGDFFFSGKKQNPRTGKKKIKKLTKKIILGFFRLPTRRPTAGTATVARTRSSAEQPRSGCAPGRGGTAQPLPSSRESRPELGSLSLPRGPSGALGSQRDKGHRKERFGLLFVFLTRSQTFINLHQRWTKFCCLFHIKLFTDSLNKIDMTDAQPVKS